MGFIIRLPFYLVAMFVWTLIGGFISIVNLAALPLAIFFSAIFSGARDSVKDILTLGILRRGYRNINRFLFNGF